ncbi:major facilitator superfamily domain-containing protein [Zychaea mexicana]|uniref:major facilitator superfamily domain-containing protein n=1 Tax=Zychaea mexicana TaxID=64656 RepID=UPI0022FEA27C|nr:major facilitator superfamily domain-containing protein [Zychaea mexicana]KAI9492679.1 major facilitator superfamily domain-containing protein [Zychaea mexicana]
MSRDQQDVEAATAAATEAYTSSAFQQQLATGAETQQHQAQQVDDSSNVVAVPATGKRSGKLKHHFKEIFGTIIVKPEGRPPSMWKILISLNNTQRLTFTAAFLGWLCDAYDFFCVSLAATYIAEDFGVEVSAVTSAITTTLMLRSIGALLFGMAADKWGRRWPLMIDIVLFSIINMASGFAPNLETFIGLRAVFGIAMGGEWGLGASLALESLPVEARGLFSGIYQEGYAAGYLVATLVNYAVQSTGSSWRIMFWAGAAFALLAVAIRFVVPESETFEKTQEARKLMSRSFFKDIWIMIKSHYLRVIYMVILMAFFNFFSHGSQDLYPTFLLKQLNYTTADQTITSVVYNIGAIVKGTIIGFYSNYFGRKISIMVSCVFVGAFIPLWIYGGNPALIRLGSFILQFFVQGAWGVVPAHLNELAPPAFRGLMPGLAYQLGNLISAASSQIQATIGEKYPLRNDDGSLLIREGEPVPNYGLTQAIFMGCVAGCLLICTMVGKEERNKDFMDNLLEDEHGNAIGANDIDDYRMEHGEASSERIKNDKAIQEKVHVEHAEQIQSQQQEK